MSFKRNSNALAIFAIVLGLLSAHAGAQSASLTPIGTTYGRAQVVIWLDHERFAVGRWDGTLTIFRSPMSGESGPVLLQDAAVPTLQPIQMITRVSSTSFVSSNDKGSLELWTERNGLFQTAGELTYSPELGVANSGVVFNWDGKQWLVTGHEQGYIVIWKIDDGKPSLSRTIMVRSSDPIPSPYKLWNVRGVAFWKNGLIVTGSEDGDLVVIKIPSGTIVSRIRFNQSAQRGINSISISDDYLVVANCTVGPSDKNLWLYRIDQGRIVPLDAMNLEKQTSRPQVYNFDVELVKLADARYFLASTEEGLIWIGAVDRDHLKVFGDVSVAPPTGGAAIATRDDGEVAAVAFDVELLRIQPHTSTASQH